MNFLINTVKVIAIFATVLLVALPLIIEHRSFKKDKKNKISHKRFRIVIYTVLYVIAVTIGLYVLQDLTSRINSISFVNWLITKIALPSRLKYSSDVLIALFINFAIAFLFRVLLRFVRIGLKKKGVTKPNIIDGSLSLVQKIERAIISFFNKEVWTTAADVLKKLCIVLSAVFAVLFILYQVPIFFDATWIPYGFLSRIFDVGYKYPIITLLALWEWYFFLAGINCANSECSELAQESGELLSGAEPDLEKIDEEVRRQFGNFYACDVDLSEVLTDKAVSSTHNADTMLIAQAVENDSRTDIERKEVYLECLDKIMDSTNSILINGGLFSSFAMYFLRYISIIVARGDNVVFVCNTDAEIESTYCFILEHFSKISSMYCRGYESEKVCFDDPIWKLISITGEGDSAAEASVDEKSILVTSLRYLSSSNFETDHERFIHLIDTVVFVDTLETVNRYNRQMAILNTWLKHITKTNARMARDGSANKAFRIRYMSHQVKYICFDDSRTPGLDKVLKNLLSVQFDSLDAMRFSPNAIVRCYNYDGRPDENGRVLCPQFIDSREEVGPLMNMAILCLANGASSVSVFADGDIPYENITESIAANMGRLPVTVDENTIRLNKPFTDTNEYSVIIAMDHEENLPKALRKYVSLAADKKTLIIVFSKPYLMRDYYYANIDKLWTNTQIARVPVEEGTKKDVAQKILVKASSGGITPDEIFRLSTGVSSLGEYAVKKDIYSILLTVLDIYDIVEEVYADSSEFNETIRQKKRLIVLDYFEFKHNCDFDENGQFCSEYRIHLRKRGKLYDVINGRDMAMLIVDENEYVLSMPKARITQNHISGQNMIFNGNIYNIRRIDTERGAIFAKLSIGGKNTEAYRYIQDREYILYPSGVNIHTLYNKHMILNRSTEEIGVKDAFISSFRVSAEVLTHGYYELDSCTLAPNSADHSYHRIDDAGNDEYARQSYRKYGSIESAHYGSDCAIAGKKGALVMTIRMTGSFGKDVDKTACLASAILGDLIRSMFPSVSDSIAVCAVTKKEEAQCAYIGQPKLTIVGNSAFFNKDDFEIALIEDSNTELGVVSALLSAGDDILETLFAPICAYLKWYQDSTDKSRYLYFGSDHEPESFDFSSLSKLACLLSDSKHDLQYVDIEKSIKRENCDFCGRSFLAGNKVNKLPDGRTICDDCSKTIVRNKKSLLKQHLNSACLFIENNYRINLGREYKVCFDSTEKIKRVLDASGVDHQIGDIPLWAYSDNKKTIHVEYGIPSASLTELLVRELSHLWLLNHIPELSKEMLEGVVALVDIQYLRFMSLSSAADAKTNSLKSSYSKAGIGYRMLVEKLKENPQYKNNPFLYLLSLQTGAAIEDYVQPEPYKIQENESSFGKAYAPKAFDRNLDGDLEYFYYSLLTAKQQSVYQLLLTAIMEHAESIDSNELHADDIAMASEALEYDRPELFWYRGCSIGINGNINICYGADLAECERLRKSINIAAEKYLEGIDDKMSAYDAAIRIYTKVLNSVDYDSIALNNEEEKGGPDPNKIDYLRSICGVFLNGKAVCEGYARAIAYLMQKSGIECSEAAGHVTKNGTNDKNGGAHAWNIIRIDGEYYYMDSTWDDDSNTIQTVKHEDFGYDYFCITSEELLRTRRSDLCPVDMPICSAVSANYYYHNDLILTKFDLEVLKTLIKNNVKAGADRFAFKCRSMSVYKETIEKLFDGAGMATQLIKEAARINRRIDTSGYSYSCNAELYTVTIRFKLKNR